MNVKTFKRRMEYSKLESFQFVRLIMQFEIVCSGANSNCNQILSNLDNFIISLILTHRAIQQ